ncbi:MAG: hypothetical protein COA52_03910 [Hyphomicrobiales bacterium]|nr:MAG: hypothetical protein COA52_03910 [Hyphomicrobiales bacterium]
MAQNDAGLVSGKIRELTRLIRKTRLADTRLGELDPAPNPGNDRAEDPAPRFARKIRAHAKLEALSNALAGVYAEIPDVAQGKEDAFTFALVPGSPPRFWVDLTSFVAVTDDGRTYHFLKDTEDDRQEVFESDNLDEMANAVADYVAARIVAQTIGGPSQDAPISLRTHLNVVDAPEEGPAREERPAHRQNPEPHMQANITPTQPPMVPMAPPTGMQQTPIIIQPAPAKTDWVKLFLAFALGLFAGAMVLFAMAWLQTPPG